MWRIAADHCATRARGGGRPIQWINIPLEQHPQNLGAGTVDAATQFAVGRPGIDRVAKGRAVTVLPYTDYLTDLYGVELGVTKKAKSEDPERIRRFNEALLKGLRDAMDSPAEAGRIYAEHQKIQPEPVAAAENTRTESANRPNSTAANIVWDIIKPA